MSRVEGSQQLGSSPDAFERAGLCDVTRPTSTAFSALRVTLHMLLHLLR
jgi:hypothetical protein